MAELSDLSRRANINVKHTYNSDVVIYEDHRTILNILYFLKFNSIGTFPINIFMFDNHDDAVSPSATLLQIITEMLAKPPTLEDFWNFTEFKLRTLDDDWVKVGMELGLINNVFLFYSSKSSIDFVSTYKTSTFGIKKIYNLGTVWDVLGDKGSLNDAEFMNAEFGELWEDIGWVRDNNGSFLFTPSNNFIVDFDLDCFTTEIFGKTYAIPQDILISHFEKYKKPRYHYFGTGTCFVKELISKSYFTTMCFENNSCGGIKESHKIFETVDFLFFEDEIGK